MNTRLKIKEMKRAIESLKKEKRRCNRYLKKLDKIMDDLFIKLSKTIHD